jgi:hypothetical protein
MLATNISVERKFVLQGVEENIVPLWPPSDLLCRCSFLFPLLQSSLPACIVRQMSAVCRYLLI